MKPGGWELLMARVAMLRNCGEDPEILSRVAEMLARCSRPGSSEVAQVVRARERESREHLEALQRVGLVMEFPSGRVRLAPTGVGRPTKLSSHLIAAAFDEYEAAESPGDWYSTATIEGVRTLLGKMVTAGEVEHLSNAAIRRGIERHVNRR